MFSTGIKTGILALLLLIVPAISNAQIVLRLPEGDYFLQRSPTVAVSPVERIVDLRDLGDPNDPNDPNPSDPLIQKYKEIAQATGDKANAINIASLTGGIAKTLREGKRTYSQGLEILTLTLDNTLPGDAKEVWEPFREALSNDVALLEQRGKKGDSKALADLLDAVVDGLEAYTGNLTEAQAREIVNKAAARGEAFNFGVVVKIVLCIIQASGDDQGFAQILQCILEALPLNAELNNLSAFHPPSDSLQKALTAEGLSSLLVDYLSPEASPSDLLPVSLSSGGEQ